MISSPIDRLIESAANDRLHHSLILHGPSPSTLHAAAFRIARALNCPDRRGDDGCASCSRVERGIHPDVQVISPLKDRKAISIEQIRGVISDAGLRPYEDGVKVFIIDPADTMSAPAANSLLKTLEEPTRDTAFILLTSSADLLLPTIRSRCQIIFMRPEEIEVPADHSAIVEDILDRLGRFASARDYGALLGIAPVVLSIEDVRQGMTLLATVLRDVAAGTADERHTRQISGPVTKRALLDAAQTSVAGIDRLNVNADVRLLIEQSLVILAAGRSDG
jgi:DNA polymerase-3 subunit delta'